MNTAAGCNGRHPSRIQITRATYELLEREFECAWRGTVAILGKSDMAIWYLARRHSETGWEAYTPLEMVRQVLQSLGHAADQFALGEAAVRGYLRQPRRRRFSEESPRIRRRRRSPIRRWLVARSLFGRA